jgi:hypothetical protein
MPVTGEERASRQRRRSGRWWLAWLLLGGLAAPSNRVAMGEQNPSRDEVQAAYLYNFGKFVRWPEGDRHGPLVVCVAGQDSFRRTIERLVAGEQISGRPLEVRSVDHPAEASVCSILFVGEPEQTQTEGFLAATAGKAILTVGDEPDFLARGGMIQFVLVEDHVRFVVNLEAANRNGVNLSSELLKVAISVKGKPESSLEKGAPR